MLGMSNFNLDKIAKKHAAQIAALMQRHLTVTLSHDATTLNITTEFDGHMINESSVDLKKVLKASR